MTQYESFVVSNTFEQIIASDLEKVWTCVLGKHCLPLY